MPPVWLGDSQLDELADLKIIDDGRYCVRLYKAGHIKPSNINAIGQKLAVAGVRDANYYPEGMHSQKRENWHEYLERERQNLSDGLVIQLPVKKKQKTAPHHWRLTRWEQASAAKFSRTLWR